MKEDAKSEAAGEQYAAAYAKHYSKGDLRGALELYRGVMAAHPDTPEARHSRTQIQNIVNAVVPMQELLDAQFGLALTHIAHGDPPEGKPGAEELSR
jgi:hypothetical protein